ncbi:MAG: hypothetical protein V9G19_24915 [Tetrasphaera sp.]
MSITVAGCAAGCRIMWGERTVASSNATGTTTLTGVVAPTINETPSEPAQE